MSYTEGRGKKRAFSVSRAGVRRGSVARIDVPESFHVELVKNKSSKVVDYFKGGSNIAARKVGAMGQSYSTSEGMKESGAVDLLKCGAASIKIGSGIGARYKSKYLVLEKGVLNIYSTKIKPSKSAEMPTILPAETSLHLVDLKAIGYQRRGDKVFGLVFSIQEELQEKTKNKRRGSVKRARSDSSISYTTGTASTDQPPRETVVQERTIYFKMKKGTDAEVWLAALLTEVKNQAKMIERIAVKMMKHPDQYDENPEGLLRQCVDLYQLGCGKFHKSTTLAQDRLAKYLKRDKKTKDEGRFWSHSAQLMGKKLKKIEKMDLGEHILHKTQNIPSESAIAQIQFQTEAIYRLKAYKEKVISMRNEAQKWKARAILYGYGDNKARKSPLKKLSYTRSNPRTNEELQKFGSPSLIARPSSAPEILESGKEESDTEEVNPIPSNTEEPEKESVSGNSSISNSKPMKKKSITSNFTLTTEAEDVRSKRRAFSKSLPSVLTETDVSDNESHEKRVQEVEAFHKQNTDLDDSRLSREPTKRSFVRAFEYSLKPLRRKKKVNDPPKIDIDVSGDAMKENKQTLLEPEAPVRNRRKEIVEKNFQQEEGAVLAVDDLEETVEEADALATTDLMRTVLNDETPRSKPTREEIALSSRLSRNTLVAEEEVTSDANTPKEKVLLSRLNAHQGHKDKVAVDLDHLRDAFEELKAGPLANINTVTLTPAVRRESIPVDKMKEVKPACYLMLSPANKGTLFLRWSKKDMSKFALAKFAPSNPDKIPSYMYRIRSGIAVPKRDELARNADTSKKKMYQGVNQFLKKAGQYKAEITLFGKNINFRVFGYTELSGRITEIPLDKEIPPVSKTYQAIATLSDNNYAFEGIKFAVKSQFLSRARKSGAAMDFS